MENNLKKATPREFCQQYTAGSSPGQAGRAAGSATSLWRTANEQLYFPRAHRLKISPWIACSAYELNTSDAAQTTPEVLSYLKSLWLEQEGLHAQLPTYQAFERPRYSELCRFGAADKNAPS